MWMFYYHNSSRDSNEDYVTYCTVLQVMSNLNYSILQNCFLAPLFVDERSFVETEEVLARMGPYICMLRDAEPKRIGMLSLARR